MIDCDVRNTIAACQTRQLDLAESQLKVAVSKGEAWAICFTLKTKGRKRGYVERLTIQVQDERTRIEGHVQDLITETGLPREDVIRLLTAELEHDVDIQSLLTSGDSDTGYIDVTPE